MRRRHISAFSTAVFVVWALASYFTKSTPQNFDAIASKNFGANALVVRAVDGDTIVVRRDGAGEDEKVRLLGIDTPESVDPRRAVECFGKEASAYLGGLVEGKRVRLATDPEADTTDKYGRLLRIVYTEAGIEVNSALVRDGYAQAYISFPMNQIWKESLKKLEQEARIAERGLWNASSCP